MPETPQQARQGGVKLIGHAIQLFVAEACSGQLQVGMQIFLAQQQQADIGRKSDEAGIGLRLLNGDAVGRVINIQFEAVQGRCQMQPGVEQLAGIGVDYAEFQ